MDRYAIVASKFNQEIVNRLIQGADRSFRSFQIKEDQIEVFWVPGAFELPLMAKKLAKSGLFSAVICLGAIIQGESAHFEHVANCCAKGILESSLDTEIPIIFSVITAYSVEQAMQRSLNQGKNEGAKGVIAAIEMVQQIKQLEELCSLSR